MFPKFDKENPGLASYSLYIRVMRENKLKIQRPKKDKCGICETYRNSSEEQKCQMNTKYQKHRMEVVAVRASCPKVLVNSKHSLMKNVVPLYLACSKISINLRKSSRGEIFYKRRLAC